MLVNLGALEALVNLGALTTQLMLRLRIAFRDGYRFQRAQDVLAPFANGGFANHSEQPRLQLTFTAVHSLALKNFQINRLQHFLGVGVVMPATAQRPAKTGLMQFL